jgi:hypothetical protein
VHGNYQAGLLACASSLACCCYPPKLQQTSLGRVPQHCEGGAWSVGTVGEKQHIFLCAVVSGCALQILRAASTQQWAIGFPG